MYKRVEVQAVGGVDGLNALAAELRGLRAADPAAPATKRVSDQLMAPIRELLIGLVNSTFRQRGSLDVDDLVQEGMLAALKSVDTYDVSRGYPFTDWAGRHARAAMVRLVRRQGADIHVSDHAHFDRAGTGEASPVIEVSSRDAREAVRTNVWGGSAHSQGCSSEDGLKLLQSLDERDDDTPESLFADAEEQALLREALLRLPVLDRELVRAHFGMGRPQQSLRDIARQRKVSRQQLDKQLSRALEELRRLLRKVR